MCPGEYEGDSHWVPGERESNSPGERETSNREETSEELDDFFSKLFDEDAVEDEIEVLLLGKIGRLEKRIALLRAALSNITYASGANRVAVETAQETLNQDDLEARTT